jgi:hypothetical protein
MNLSIRLADADKSFNLLMIDIGDISKMIGYTFRIIDYLGKVVFETLIDEKLSDVDLSSIRGRGTYFMEVIDDASQILEVKKIILR